MFTVLLDACVLVPPTLADTVLRTAESGAFGVRWSPDILQEVQRTMHKLGTTLERAQHRVAEMEEAFPLASVQDYASLQAVLTNHPKDRHVLAAALRSECHTIVTFNLKDFPPSSVEPWGVETVHPDQFLLNQLDLAPGHVLAALRQQSQDYNRPPMSISDLLARLSRSGVPEFADECRRHLPPILEDDDAPE